MMRGILLFCLVIFRYTVRCETPIYKKEGTEVTLSPDKTGPVKSVLWRQGDNFAMEYHGGTDPPLAYRQFKERGSLNTDDGAMTIKELTRNDSGLYKVEINNKANKIIPLEVIAGVGKPHVSKSCHDDGCDLTCEGYTAEAAPITYYWIFDKKHTKTDTKEWKLTKFQNVEKEIKCELENPVSSQQSDPIKNPFFQPVYFSDDTWIIVAVIVVLIVLLLLLLFFVLYRRGVITRLIQRFRPTQDAVVTPRKDDEAPGKDDEAPGEDDEAPGEDDETIPLKGLESIKVEQPGPSDDPTQRTNGTGPLLSSQALYVEVAAPDKDDKTTPLNGPESIKVEQPGPSDDPTQRTNGTEVEVSADVHPTIYENIGEAPTSSDSHGNANVDKPDDGGSAPDKKPQEDEHQDTED